MLTSQRHTSAAAMPLASPPPVYDEDLDPPLLVVDEVTQPQQARVAVPLESGQATEPSLTAAPAAPANPPSPVLVEGTVKKGQTALAIFRQAGVEAAQVMALQQAVRSVYDIHRLHIGQPYRIESSPEGELQRFTYEIDSQRQLQVERQQQTFVGRVEPIHYARRERVVSGRIDDTLYATLTARGESSRLVGDFADIFAWSIDFYTDLRQGDIFRLLIEERWRHGNAPRYHRILAAELVNKGRVLEAVYYAHDNQGAYYQPDGRSLRGMFLRSPLRYTRISSRFSHRRLHPILKRYRPHLGIDYAAPSGTPVRSVGAGTVQWAGRKGANGKMVKIRHDKTYTTYYLHLSRFTRGVRSGARVEQGQVIGYVGSTGLSTGPHLDFRMSKHGQYLNPLTLKSVEAPPLPKQALPAFQSYTENLLAKLALSEPVLQRYVSNVGWE